VCVCVCVCVPGVRAAPGQCGPLHALVVARDVHVGSDLRLCVMCSVIHIALVLAGRRYEDDFERFHDLEHWPGGLLLLVYAVVGAYAVYGFARIKLRHGLEVRERAGSLTPFIATWCRWKMEAKVCFCVGHANGWLHCAGRVCVCAGSTHDHATATGRGGVPVGVPRGRAAGQSGAPALVAPSVRAGACDIGCMHRSGVSKIHPIDLSKCGQHQSATRMYFIFRFVCMHLYSYVCASWFVGQFHHVRVAAGGRRRSGCALGVVRATAVRVFQAVLARQDRGCTCRPRSHDHAYVCVGVT
jgi:hypothetical protein